ncbi:AAA family ATPase, partial [Candidatus Poribacteria bacterium]|nr:AAA family ATPase [Candidatus Poribacteria bacterium]
MNLTPNQTEALDINNHICVTAGAGSGKTTVLVDRYLNILKLRENVNPDQIAAITFTEKAAAEMKGRIIKELREPEYAHIRDRHLEKMHSAPISTFHAFCSRILRENPFQAGVPANFGVLETIEKKLLLKQTIKDTLQEIATDTEDRHREELERCLQSFTDSATLVEMLISLLDKRDVMKHLLDTVYSDSAIERLPTQWEKAYQSVLPSSAEIEKFIQCLNAVLQIARGKKKQQVGLLTTELAGLSTRDNAESDVQNILKEIAELITTKGNKIATDNFIGRNNDTSDLENEISFMVSLAIRIKEAPTVDCADVDSDDFLLLSVTRDLLTLYQRVLQEYQIAKLSQSKLDFADLQIYTRNLLKNNDKIRKKLLNQYKFYMVDEFQDTNELQYELVMLLTDELKQGNLFIVGDPKQSIYGFRDADVRVFEKTQEKIVSMGGKDIHLKENFRSLQNSVGFANYLFARLMGDEKENDFEVIYEPLNVGKTDNEEGVVEIILGQKDSDTANALNIESTLLAQHIKHIVSNEQHNRDNSKPVKYGDIAILIRARRHLPDIENALHLAGIPYLTSGGIGFYQRQEIYDIWNYLNFLNAPDVNDLSLIGILRGPAFGISDNELFEISPLQKGEGFWLKTQNYNKKTDRLKTAVTILKEHHKVAHRLPVNQLILTIVNETGLIGTLKTGSKGEQRWANYQKLLAIARTFEAQENRPTLTDFIEYLDILITDEPREGDAPIEEDSNSVKIMTIHAAKGKEYPVVILPCLNRQGQGSREPFIDEKLGIGFKPLIPSQNYDQSSPEIVLLMKNIASTKDEAEKKRLLYVATTRAKNRLILSGTLKENGEAENTLKMLFQLLEINKEDKYKEISDTLNFYRNGENISKGFHLKIPIIKQLEVTSDNVRVDGDSVVSFPKRP